MPRFALSEPSIGSTTTSVAPVAVAADLLGHDRHVEVAEAGEDRVLRRLVDRRRVVAAFALAYDGLALDARRQLVENRAHVLDGRAADRDPVRHSA